MSIFQEIKKTPHIWLKDKHIKFECVSQEFIWLPTQNNLQLTPHWQDTPVEYQWTWTGVPLYRDSGYSITEREISFPKEVFPFILNRLGDW